MKLAIRIAAWTIALGIFAFGGWMYFQQRQVLDTGFIERVDSALLNFDVTWLAKIDPGLTAFGGGMGLHDEGLFIGQKADEGQISFLDVSTDTLLATGATLPVAHRSAIPATTPSGVRIDRNLLRYNDLATITRNGTEYLLVSYSYFYEDNQCFVARLAEAEMTEGWLSRLRNGDTMQLGGWKVVFETTPCLPIVDNTGFPFTGHQAGGRMTIDTSGDIFLTSGDYGFDGLEGKLPPHPQVPDSGYGKVIRITPSDAETWASEIYAMGLRNPQGITVDDQNRIWVSDHGAMGGDELNLITEGTNYGWPAATTGINYTTTDSDDKYWVFNQTQGDHAGFAPPAYAWIPSIAPANVKFLTGLSPRWDGDLLVGALKQGSLVRLQLEGDRVVVAEHIGLSRRVRYVEVGHGRLYILFDYGELAILTPREMTEEHVEFAPLLDETYDPANPGDVTFIASGSILNSRGCLECHSGGNAPNLTGLYDRDIASQPGVTYSDALRAKSGNWTEDNLRAFLRDTQAFAPGTTMPTRALSEDDITAIIDALKFRQDI